MTNHHLWKSRIRDITTLIVATVALSGAALWNGYPLVWPDTGAYIQPINLVFRSVFYNFLIAPLTWPFGSLWPIVFFQSLVVAYLMRLVLRAVFEDGSPRTFVLVTLGVATLTSLPWETGFVMADVYASVAVLALFLLAFCEERLSGRERLLVSTILLTACAVHLTHPVIAAGLLALFTGFRWASRTRPGWPAPRLVMPAVPVALSVVLLIGNNAIVHGEVRYSVGGYAFTLARLVENGPAIDFLRETCPVRHYALCDSLDTLPRNSDLFLWPPDSAFRKLGGFSGYRKEGREIVSGTIRRFPGRVARAAAGDGIRQIFKARTGHGLVSYLDQPWPTREIREFFPRDLASYENSKQSRGELGIDGLWELHFLAIVLGNLGCAGLAVYLARRGPNLMVLLLGTIASGYVLNAFLCALSVPSDRYGARVAWMIPFFCLAWAGSARGRAGGSASTGPAAFGP